MVFFLHASFHLLICLAFTLWCDSCRLVCTLMRCQATTPQEQDDFPFPSAATPRTVAVDGFLANQDDYQITLSGGPGAGAVGTPLYTLQFRYPHLHPTPPHPAGQISV